jgi:anti-sigma B factor antagonist
MLKIEVVRYAGTAVVELSGEVDLSAKQDLSGPLLAVVRADDVTHIDIDVAKVTFLDSSGISVFLVARREAIRLGRTLRLRNVGGIVARVLTITGILPMLTGEPATAPD